MRSMKMFYPQRSPIILNYFIQVELQELENLSKNEFLTEPLDMLDLATETDSQNIKKPP